MTLWGAKLIHSPAKLGEDCLKNRTKWLEVSRKGPKNKWQLKKHVFKTICEKSIIKARRVYSIWNKTLPSLPMEAQWGRNSTLDSWSHEYRAPSSSSSQSRAFFSGGTGHSRFLIGLYPPVAEAGYWENQWRSRDSLPSNGKLWELTSQNPCLYTEGQYRQCLTRYPTEISFP